MVARVHAGPTAVFAVGSPLAFQAAATDAADALALLPPAFPSWILIGASATLLILAIGWLVRSRLLEHRRGARAARAEQAVYDPVTGLPGRRLFLAVVGQALARATRTGNAVAVLLVELTHFRVVEETRGRMNGDTVIRVQAARLKGALRSTDLLARVEPDRFAAVLEHVSATDVVTIAQKMHQTVETPLMLEGEEIFLSCRIGSALYPEDAADGPGLLERAAHALALVKAEGRPIRPAGRDVGSAGTSTPLVQPAVHSS